MSNSTSPEPTPVARRALAPQRMQEAVTRRALIVWAGAVAVYVVAMLGRTSFGVAGVEAIARFEVDASRIAVFTSVQVGVYALAQIPTGVLIDRFGPRFMLVAGAVVMALGQVVLGFTSSYWVAIAARILIGAGDASAFLAVMRILPAWFPPGKTPLFTQLSTALGQMGQFLSAVPFLALLHVQGWTVAFVTLGAVGVLVALAAWVAVADSPLVATRAAQTERAALGPTLATVVRSPIVWEAFFIHAFVIFFMVSFTLLWGMPLMTLGMGLPEEVAGSVLIVFTVTTIVISPVLGALSARLGNQRDKLAIAAGCVTPVAFFVFFSTPTARPLGAIMVVVVLLAIAVPTSNYGFDNIREHIQPSMLATATGLANMGGFSTTMIAAQLVGVLLDYSADGVAYTWQDFRFAWIAFYVIAALLLLGLLLARAKAQPLMRKVRIVAEHQAHQDTVEPSKKR